MRESIHFVKREGARLALIRGALGGFALVLALTALGLAPSVAAANPPSSLGLKATYDVRATLKWAKKRLFVVSVATVRNTTDDPVSELVFNFAPAQIGQMVMNRVLVGADPATWVKDDQNVIVSLPAALAPGQQTTVMIDYKSTFNTTSGGKKWLYAKLNGIVTAYRWIPWLSRVYDFATPTFGEPFVTQVSDEVRVNITVDRPGVVIASTGRRTGVNGLTQTFVANRVRDFNFTASPKYQTQSETWGDVSITYYYVNLSLDRLRTNTINSLQQFTNLVGPYRYNELSVAESHVGYAMESPGHIWIPGNSPASNVRYLVTHEMAHQWFYGVVGNDQASQPFADEAMAEFLTRHLIGHRNSQCAQDVLDKHVYGYTKACYYETLYVQGDSYIEAYRQRVGDDVFWDGVKRYYEEYSFRIGGTKRLWDILDDEAGPTGGGHETRFPSLYPGQGG